jgi:hypothetical protein
VLRDIGTVINIIMAHNPPDILTGETKPAEAKHSRGTAVIEKMQDGVGSIQGSKRRIPEVTSKRTTKDVWEQQR